MNIDAVIPWVDGADPAHRQRLEAHLASRGGGRPPAARPTRFHDAGELDWCVASILRFAPWFRRIHVVTDRQEPALVARLRGTPAAARVRVVDHREIFAGHEHCLPTFNSRTISAVLWRIPDLAEHYVCFNDDFMILRPIEPAAFFRDDRVVLRGAWHAQAGASALAGLRRLFKRARGDADGRAGNREAQELSARLAGFGRRYFRLPHVPYPYRRATLQAFFAAHPDLLGRQLAHALRSPEQFLAESLAAHLEIAAGHAAFDDDLRVVQLKPGEQREWRLRAKLRAADRDARIAFACVQSLDQASAALQAEIAAWLDRRIGRVAQVLAGG
ncbi:Stealth CR1 domain-containing protein [Dokdonella fugitiva]|jgi:hypothetical protein|uniref:Stealth CR1 domain-containing protein n=1 Tax=Dokdonella fugitiva TaxID=328517 RepID=UPI0018053567|nr:Stealth CR1 domain-containing protein [Dokdonella fugitiva]MBA8882239.1 hypothetical protein [Dokdonella fugitiva]